MADFDADAVREQMARVIDEGAFDCPEESMWDIELAETQAMDVLPIAVRAVTDAVRELHQPEPLTGYWDDCSEHLCDHEGACQMETRYICSKCGYLNPEAEWQAVSEYPCQTVRLLDAIDKAAGVQRDE